MAWAPLYADKEDLKGHLSITGVGADAELTRAITAACRNVDRYCDRQFGQVDSVEQRIYVAEWDRSIGAYVTVIDDLENTAGLIVEADGNTIASADYRLEPRNADKINRPFETIVTRTATSPTLGGGEYTLEMTALWGWNAIPTEVEQASLLEGAKLFVRRDAPFGIAGSPDLGSEMRMLALVDPDARNLLMDLRRGTSFS